jgi:hypothetical protein
MRCPPTPCRPHQAHAALPLAGSMLSVALAAAPAPAHACAVCACGDPTLVTMGAELPFTGRTRASVELLARSDRVGRPGIDQVTLHEQTATLGLAWAPGPRWVGALTLPVGRRAVTDARLARTVAGSPGDLGVRARAVALSRTGPGRHALGPSLGLRLPTAPVGRAADGTPLPMSAQLGGGGVRGSAGAWGLWSRAAWSAWASAEAELPAPGGSLRGFAESPGPGLRASTLAQWQPGLRAGVRAGFDGRADTPARDRRGQPARDTGGALVFTRADLIWSPGTDWVLVAGGAVPVWDALRGAHDEGPTFTVGLTRDL